VGRGGAAVRGALAALALALCAADGAAADEALFDPASGYRIARYRAPTPDEPPSGVLRISAEETEALIAKGGVVLVDVLPSDGAGWDAASRSWRLAHGHSHIPGSTWLPDVGQGTLDAAHERYFRDNLARLTGGDMGSAVVIYCQADCWMSWNAAKRAVALGYRDVRWLPEGVDGWRDFDRPLSPADPVPLTP
jgi:PQQ-dependent catabolism-associated CXXCW motif protein